MRYVCPECGGGGEAEPCPADGAMRAPVGADALLGTTIGSWRVARLLGAGGMGRVYVAVQPQIGARVAIKVLKRESAANPEVVERFFNEARAVNMIKHEAIVDVIDLGRLPDGAPYIVMEYLDGASLGAIVRRARRLPLGTLATTIGDVLAALAAAHAKAIIHRDLKPDNVFVSPSGRVTVLDFGVAKLAAGNDSIRSTQTGSLLGTPAYMSPEQARSQPLDARADLYAVGVMLYEAATGTLPFVAANLFDLLQMHVEQTPRPPRELTPEMAEAFEAVILRALAKDPADRFGSATEMRTALLDAAKDLPRVELASLMISPEPPGREQKSDPYAETAASDSLATGETQPSTPPSKPATGQLLPPREPVSGAPSIQLTRNTLLALLGGAALLGLGGAALMMYLGKSKPAPEKPVSVQLDDLDLMNPSEGIDDAPTITMPNEEAIPIADPKAFDPMAAYTAARARATQFGGPSTQLYSMLLNDVDRNGVIDLASGEVEIIFSSPALAKAGEPCLMMFDFDKAGGRFSTGRPEHAETCADGVGAPRCPFATLLQRAVAKGLPAKAKVATFNRYPGQWLVSAGQWSDSVDDDCP